MNIEYEYEYTKQPNTYSLTSAVYNDCIIAKMFYTYLQCLLYMKYTMSGKNGPLKTRKPS